MTFGRAASSAWLACLCFATLALGANKREFMDSFHLGLQPLASSEFGGGFSDTTGHHLYSIGYMHRRPAGYAVGWRAFLFPAARAFLYSAGLALDYELRSGDWYFLPSVVIGGAAATFNNATGIVAGNTKSGTFYYGSAFMGVGGLQGGYDFGRFSLYLTASYHLHSASLTQLNAAYAGIGLRIPESE